MKLVHRDTSGRLPTSSFDLVDDAGHVLGFAQLSHRPSGNADLPPEAGNNIYYEVSEAHRGRGHGKVLLRLVLIEVRRIGLPHVSRMTTPPRATSWRAPAGYWWASSWPELGSCTGCLKSRWGRRALQAGTGDQAHRARPGAVDAADRLGGACSARHVGGRQTVHPGGAGAAPGFERLG
jgi:hypothetical protein